VLQSGEDLPLGVEAFELRDCLWLQQLDRSALISFAPRPAHRPIAAILWPKGDSRGFTAAFALALPSLAFGAAGSNPYVLRREGCTMPTSKRVRLQVPATNLVKHLAQPRRWASCFPGRHHPKRSYCLHVTFYAYRSPQFLNAMHH
jgi:hypothetical protein